MRIFVNYRILRVFIFVNHRSQGFHKLHHFQLMLIIHFTHFVSYDNSRSGFNKL